KILHGDCLELMKQIPDGSIDLILTDPPYNISQNDKKIERDNIQNRKIRRLVSRRANKNTALSYDFGKWDRYDSVDAQLEFAEKWLKESYRILKDNGQIITFYSKSEISFLEAIMQGIGFIVRQTLVWHKTNPVPQIFKVGYMSAAEFFTWATKSPGGKHTFNYQLGQKHNVFTYGLCQGNERTEHPTQKPLKLIKDVLQYHTKKDDLVLDPFCGSGTICVAAKELGCNYSGFDSEQKYVNITNRRLHNTVAEMFR
ncbi:MAG: DNA methyltransferase, partial [Patescibacteria group bacterium]